MAVVDQNINRCPAKTRAATRAAAEAFVEYLFTPEAQAEFAAVGFRYAAGLGTLPYLMLSKHPGSLRDIWTVLITRWLSTTVSRTTPARKSIHKVLAMRSMLSKLTEAWTVQLMLSCVHIAVQRLAWPNRVRPLHA